MSAVSTWELAAKARIGTMPAAEKIVDSYGEYLDGLGALVLPISPAARAPRGVDEWEYKDPSDRMLAALAILEDLSLIPWTRRSRVWEVCGSADSWPPSPAE